MHVLVAHNFYRSSIPSGENDAVLEDVRLLRAHGHRVTELFASSDELTESRAARARAAFGPIYNRTGVTRVQRALSSANLDLVHIHNVYPMLSPAILSVAQDHGVPVVQTIHNYRHTCVAGTHLRAGAICSICVDSAAVATPVLSGCYRGSRSQTLAMRLGQLITAPRWRTGVDRYICLTDFMRRWLIEAFGVSPECVVVRPTPVEDPAPSSPDHRSRAILFVGRLSEEKGILDLLDVWNDCGAELGAELQIAGDGPLAPVVADRSRISPFIRYLGRLDPLSVRIALKAVQALAVPSNWYEGFPRVIAEAFSTGTPVIARAIGGLPEIVGSRGWLFRNPSELRAVIAEAIESTPQAATRGSAARDYFRAHLSHEAAYRSLIATYEDAVHGGNPRDGTRTSM